MQMEFKPGQSYFFISTSSDRDMHRRVGGWCSTKNMKMIFRWETRHDEEYEDDRQLQLALSPHFTTLVYDSSAL